MDSTLVETPPAPRDNLTEDEAQARSSLLSNLAYNVSLQLSDDPSVDTFLSSTELTFDAQHEDAETFLDLAARSVEKVELNGRTLAEAEHRFNGTRLTLPGLRRGSNRVHVIANCEYQHTGVGLHRLCDPIDQQVYLYTHFEPFDAHKVLACFDQPDLKAPVTMTVSAPTAWRVCGNASVLSAESRDGVKI